MFILMGIVNQEECLPATKFDLSSLYSDEDPVVTEDNVLSFFLKYRNLPYKYQLEMKMKRTQDAVSELLEHLRDSDTRISNYINQYPPIIEETVPSMLIDGYTIDNYFHIAKDKETGEVKIGLKVFNHGRSVIAPISECVNIPRYMAQLAQAFVAALPEMEQLKLYDDEIEEGDLLGIGIQMNFIGQLLLTVHVVREHIPTETNVDSKDKKDSNKKGPKGRFRNRQGGGDNTNTAQQKPEETETKEGSAEVKEEEGEKKEVAETKKDGEVKDEGSEEAKGKDEKVEEVTEDKPKEVEGGETKESEESSVTNPTEESTAGDDAEKATKTGDETMEVDEQKEEAPPAPPVVKKVHISDQDLKQILMDFYKKYGSDLGVESIYYKLCYYQNKKEVGNKFNEYVRVVGPACLQETLGGVSFMVNPERMWAPPNRSFEAILSVVERLGRIGPDTIVVLVSTDQRYVPLYLSKKCKEVIALGCWNFQTSYNAKRIADSKGCRNTEYCNVTGKLPVSVWNRLQSKQRVVAIFWDNADTNVLNKLLNMGCCNFIDVVSSEKRFSKSLYRHIVHADLRIVPTVVVPVDSHPHTDRYALVVKFSSPNMSPQLMNKRKKKNQGYHHQQGPPPQPLMMQGPHHPPHPPPHFKRTRGFGSKGQWPKGPPGDAEGSSGRRTDPRGCQRGGGGRNQYRGKRRGGSPRPGAVYFTMRDTLRSIKVYGYDGGGGFEEVTLDVGTGATISPLMEVVWGRHNTTMTMEERYRVLGRTYPPS
ncbi:hypothetical protein AAG570_000840 [Ranatra chinensis]|uniref:Uncharacterized protein n=1 Tax=Ranatra chinensis TaxID=642074 RepID=A0ABD0YY93_9HEMI